MKNQLKKTSIWIVLSALMLVFWIGGIMIGNIIFPSDLMDATEGSESSGLLIMLFISAVNTASLLLFLYNTERTGWKLLVTVFGILFGIQYFMSQIETVWFNDSLQISRNGIWAIVSGGAIMAILFALSAVALTGKWRKKEIAYRSVAPGYWPEILKMTAVIALVVWPLIYFIAGYYIAWQFEAVRMFYSGSSEKASFLFMMKENFASHLYSFQILRGGLWVAIALLVFHSMNGGWIKKGVILALLLTALGSSSLLLPNPIMPELVRMGHLLETSISGLVLGMVMAWMLVKIPAEKLAG